MYSFSLFVKSQCSYITIDALDYAAYQFRDECPTGVANISLVYKPLAMGEGPYEE